MKVSIIIIVKNDKGVKNTLQYIKKYENVDKLAEIIVVDASNGELDDIKIAMSIKKWFSFKSKSRKRITIPEQRNFGIKKSDGEIIAFIDANCIPDNKWLEELVKPIIEGKEKIVAGAIWSLGNNKFHDIKNSTLKNKKYLEEAATMNLAIKKEVFEEVGYFDESFDYGSDIDFTRRAVKAGYTIYYNENAKLYHDWGDFRTEVKRALKYGEARIDIYKHNKVNLIEILKKDHISIIYPAYILLLPIVFIWPYYVFFLLIPIVKNFKSYPIKTTILNFTYGIGILKKILHTNIS